MSMLHGNSSSGNDPRQPWTAKPYMAKKVASEEQALDYSGFIAVILGVAGLMFRHKLSSWFALIFCAQSLANIKNYESDLKHITMALMFAVMGLVSNYFGATNT